jgi:PAS domain S-box-containing protein
MASLGHESESKHLLHIFDSIPSLIHTGRPDGYLDYFNQHWLEYLGIPIEALLGWKCTAVIHPEDVDDIVAKWRLSIASGEPFLHEARVRGANGEYRWRLHHKVAVHNEHGKIIKWYGSSIDIEERKIAEEKIREQEAELRQIVELMPQHIGVLAPDGSRLYANHTALEYFGITLEQWRDPKAHGAHPEDREHFAARNKRFLEGKPHEFEARLLRHDGEFRYFLFRRTPLKDERGHITRWYVTATDIQDRKQAEHCTP